MKLCRETARRFDSKGPYGDEGCGDDDKGPFGDDWGVIGDDKRPEPN